MQIIDNFLMWVSVMEHSTIANMSNAGFYSNTAGRNGGAIYFDQQSKFATDQLTIIGNQAQSGGAIYCNYGHWQSNFNSTIRGNYQVRLTIFFKDVITQNNFSKGSNIVCQSSCSGDPCGCTCHSCELCVLGTVLTNNSYYTCSDEYCTAPPTCSRFDEYVVSCFFSRRAEYISFKFTLI